MVQSQTKSKSVENYGPKKTPNNPQQLPSLTAKLNKSRYVVNSDNNIMRGASTGKSLVPANNQD